MGKHNDRYYKRTIEVEIEVVRPDYTSSDYSAETLVSFVSRSKKSQGSKVSSALLSYEFEESIHDVDSPFSFQITAESDSDGKTWFDKIKKKDLIFIKEHGKTRYAGFVRATRYSSRISEDGKPERNISITGDGFGKALKNFTLILDMHIWLNNSTAQSAATTLKGAIESNIDEDRALVDILKKTYKAFFDLVQACGQVTGKFGLRGILDNFIDYDSRLDKEKTVTSLYPMAISLYQVGENSVWGIWQNMLNPPIHELFGTWNPETNKYELVFRQSPFEPDDWKALPSHELDPLILSDFDLGTDDAEVKTFYLGILPGSGIDRNKALVIDSYDGSEYSEKDEDKWAIYGYRPMIVEFKYFRREKQKEFSGAAKVMKDLAIMMKRWFEHNDEFYTGSFLLHNIDDPDVMKYMKIGEKLTYEGMEFYIEQTKRKWDYGDEASTTLSVSRGYRYDEGSGNYLGEIKSIGQKLKKIENEVFTV